MDFVVVKKEARDAWKVSRVVWMDFCEGWKVRRDWRKMFRGRRI